MADPLASVAPGDPLNITAETWNQLLEAVAELRRGPAGARGPALDSWRPASLVRVRNGTGATLARGAVVTPSGAALDPEDAAYAARRAPEFSVAAPAAGTDPVLVMFEAVADGETKRAVAAGATVATVVVSDAAHRFARPVAGVTAHLESADSGPAYLLTPPGVGTFETYVLLGAPSGAGDGSDGSGVGGFGWVAALTTADCLAVSVDGVAKNLYLASADGATWARDGKTVTICGKTFAVAFTKGGCTGPCLTLTTATGSSVTYTGTRDRGGCSYAVFAFPTAALCDTDDTAADPCTRVTRVRVDWSCCPIDGWDGAGWYCVRDAGTDDECTVVELGDGDRCNSGIEICRGRFGLEIEAEAACGPPGTGCTSTEGLLTLGVTRSHMFCNRTCAAFAYHVPVTAGNSYYFKFNVGTGGGTEPYVVAQFYQSPGCDTGMPAGSSSFVNSGDHLVAPGGAVCLCLVISGDHDIFASTAMYSFETTVCEGSACP